MRRFLVPGLPFAFSLCLSICTVGSTVFWQDSGFFLTAVREMSVLYPHGFVLYLLLCKAWTLIAAPVVGFTLAVHLFSALAAAAGAAFLALASRDHLRRSGVANPEGPAVVAACLVAAGYCYWHAAILAKPYALYDATLAAVLWLLVRAEGKRDYWALAAVLGIAGAAHPSAALILPAVALYAGGRRDRLREWGPGFVAALGGLAVLIAALPSFLLPVLASRGSPADLGSPRSVPDVLAYLLGFRFTTGGAFGFSGIRWALGARYLAEELLVGSAVFLTLGLVLGKGGGRRWIAAWVAANVVVPILFRKEGQFDQWLVAAVLPLSLPIAEGVAWARGRSRAAAYGLAVAAAASMAAVNLPLLDQRHDDGAEQFGRCLIRNLDRDAIVLFSTDDPLATTLYLQHVRGERPDLHPVNTSYLGQEWFERLSARVHRTRTPDYAAWRRQAPELRWEVLALTAFADENAAAGRAVFSEARPEPGLLRPGVAMVPAGMLWKVAPAGRATLDERYWDYPVRPEDIPRHRRRARGFFEYDSGDGVVGRAEPYEDRFFLPLVNARSRLGDAVLAANPAKALDCYDAVLRVLPEDERDLRLLVNRGVALLQLRKHDEALAAFRDVLRRNPPGDLAVFALFYLGEASEAAGKKEEARRSYEDALRLGPPPPLRREIEQRLRR